MSTNKMRCPARLSAAEKFFWTHAGYSWNASEGETQAAGRERCARNLAAAEGIAREAGYNYDWDIDQCTDSSDWSDERSAWAQYVCVMRDVNGKAVQSLSGIDFGKDAAGPYGDYRRVVEAELAAQECDAMLRELGAA